jgi:hypothetical protein
VGFWENIPIPMGKKITIVLQQEFVLIDQFVGSQLCVLVEGPCSFALEVVSTVDISKDSDPENWEQVSNSPQSVIEGEAMPIVSIGGQACS